MFVVDKVVDEDRREDSRPELLAEKVLPNGTHISLGPSAVDAYAVFEDLCLLANGEKPHFLKLEFLRKTFALELIESVLTNYHDLFRKVRICAFLTLSVSLTIHAASRIAPPATTSPMPLRSQGAVRSSQLSSHTSFHTGRIPTLEAILRRTQDRV